MPLNLNLCLSTTVTTSRAFCLVSYIVGNLTFECLTISEQIYHIYLQNGIITIAAAAAKV